MRWLDIPLSKAMAPHSSTFAWKVPWTEEPGGLQFMWSLRVRHDWATSLSLFTFMHWRRKWQPTPVFLPGESQGRKTWLAAVYGVAQSRTRLKRRSSKSLSAINVSVMTVSLSIYVDGKSPSTVDVDAVNSFPRPLCNILVVKEDENWELCS